jgi:hypothetical protein
MAYLRAELDELLALAQRRFSLEETYRGLALDELISTPEIRWDAATLGACDEAYERHVAPGGGGVIPREEIGVPAWIFIEYLAQRRRLLLHGSGNGDIAEFTPRTANDNITDGDTAKVHAASSGLVATFYAIIDRPRLLEIPCVPAFSTVQARREGMADGLWFVADWRALPFRPWRGGTVYVLARDTFRDEHRAMQWTSAEPVRPLARIAVTPDDFPLLDQVYGLDFAEDHRRAHAGITGFPWRGDPAVYPDPRFRPPAL